MHKNKKDLSVILKTSIFLLLMSGAVQAQPARKVLDSLYNSFVDFKNHSRVEKTAGEEHSKCGLPVISGVLANLEYFDEPRQQVLKSLMQRPQTAKSVVSPKGYYRLHYDEAGTHAPAYNVDSLLNALDYVYDFEVVELSNTPPPADNGDGGDNLYDVYIQELGSGVYGYTQPEGSVSSGSGRYMTYIVIDNDFRTHPTKGLNGAKVTAAHEFYHAIQIGAYYYRYEDDGFFYELSSTAMEEFVYDQINDYYYYMNNYFRTPSRPFNRFAGGNDGYDLAVWNIHLLDKYGFDILRRQWELMPEMRAMHAINKSLLENGSSFSEEYSSFGTRLYFTGYRKHPQLSFDESQNYPLVSYVSNINFSSPSETFTGSAYPCSQNYIRLLDKLDGRTDSLVILITNGDVNSGVNGKQAEFQYQYSVYDYDEPGSYRLNPDLKFYAKFAQNNQSNWSSTGFLNDQLINEAHPVREGGDFAYPSPFRYGNPNHFQLVIPVEDNPLGEADLSVFTSGMDLVYSGTIKIENQRGYPSVKWQPLHSDNKRLSTGIYIYVTKSGDTVKKGKIAVFNE